MCPELNIRQHSSAVHVEVYIINAAHQASLSVHIIEKKLEEMKKKPSIYTYVCICTCPYCII